MNHQVTILPILAALKDTPSERLESDSIEFKEYRSENALHNAKDLAEEISALANRQGGMNTGSLGSSGVVISYQNNRL